MGTDRWDGPGANYGQMQPGAGGYEGESSLPWQNVEPGRSAIGAMAQTVGRVLGQPSRAFSRIRSERSLASSLLYVLILGTIGGWIGLAWQVAFQALTARGGGQAPAAAAVGGPAIYAAIGAVLTPLLVIVGSFIGAGILHLCLLIVGGANETFEATYAVVAYATGSTALLAIIPVCGGLVGAVWAIVVEIIGLSRAHRTTGGRAALAVLLPIVLCFGLAVAVGLMVGIIAAGGP